MTAQTTLAEEETLRLIREALERARERVDYAISRWKSFEKFALCDRAAPSAATSNASPARCRPKSRRRVPNAAATASRPTRNASRPVFLHESRLRLIAGPPTHYRVPSSPLE